MISFWCRSFNRLCIFHDYHNRSNEWNFIVPEFQLEPEYKLVLIASFCISSIRRYFYGFVFDNYRECHILRINTLKVIKFHIQLSSHKLMLVTFYYMPPNKYDATLFFQNFSDIYILKSIDWI